VKVRGQQCPTYPITKEDKDGNESTCPRDETGRDEEEGERRGRREIDKQTDRQTEGKIKRQVRKLSRVKQTNGEKTVCRWFVRSFNRYCSYRESERRR